MILLLRLFFEFFKTGLFSVGGGLATLPFLYEMSSNTHWFTHRDVADMIAISESTPGAIGINMATYAGYKTAGVPGGICATLGLALGLAGIASFVILSMQLVGMAAAGSLTVDPVALLFLLGCLGLGLSIAGTVFSGRGRRNPKGRAIGIIGMILSIIGIVLSAAAILVTLMILMGNPGSVTETFLSVMGFLKA